MNSNAKCQLGFGLALLFFALFGLWNPATAAGSTAVPNESLSHPLDSNPTLRDEWFEANYYESTGRGKHSSEIVNDDFFVSLSGRTNPVLEFDAFSQAVDGYHDNGQHEALICRYPARISLFRRNNLLPADWRNPNCPEYQEIVKPDDIRSISLVFASGYFENPASYYGHTMLKFNYAGADARRSVLDTSINFGADVEDDISSPMYVLRGLMGGYTASYTRNNYFIYSHLYTNNNLRDVWEFDLDLSEDERRFIVEHSWEMKDADFQYYFFNDNCAHRIARLVELATESNLSDSHGFWLLPIQVVRNLRQGADSRKLIGASSYVPSLKTRFSENFMSLEPVDQQQFIDYFRPEAKDRESRLREATTGTLLLKLDYLDLENAKLTIKAKDDRKSTEIDSERALVLREMLTRPPEAPAPHEYRPPESPLDARPPSRLMLSLGARDGSTVWSVGYRVANHDLLDGRGPGMEASTLVMGELEFERNGESTTLRRAVFFDVTNINTNPLPTWMTNERTWGMRLDYAPQSRACTDCTNFGFEARSGKAKMLNANLLVYGLLGGRLHTSTSRSGGVFTITSELGLLLNPVQKITLGLKGNAFLNASSGDAEWVAAVDVAFEAGRRTGVRIGYERQGDEKWLYASAAYYFD